MNWGRFLNSWHHRARPERTGPDPWSPWFDIITCAIIVATWID